MKEWDLKTMLRMLRKKLWLILLFTLICTGGTLYYSMALVTPVYEASTKLIVNKTRIVEGESTLNLNDLEANMQLISTYKELIKTDWMIKDVLAKYSELNMNSKALRDSVTVSSTNKTQVMTISAIAPSYELASKIANGIAEQFMKKIPDLMQVDNVTILNPADPALEPGPVKPNIILNALVAFILSFMISIGTIFVREYFDDSIRVEEELQQLLSLPTLAVIPKINRKSYKSAKHRQTSISYTKAGEATNASTNA
ncbi:Wzz/FepE/Etk N-terminal domain-containing protein [Paenibacillus profundus]|uniref:Wzz/FepE/Etk N-terminal domain-containing protein n=1 Tax=Paenibacillus profundus TaxID=1173085 RepID=A0ABS8YAH4_9BACL|nr:MULTISPECIES: Wzz/FepE/Etk N-terminal domain-containing protein [Paenibacillus]MCE5168926.1 Wzz/FepE/Etk N-terminal domain-containing protein [Paenibacillus profundus]MCM3338263.1 Wzz/FepE/Etk N-terminal domain-containing protein [Paenibacillus sp. MER TA 81-3]